jgi:hypothetical protein
VIVRRTRSAWRLVAQADHARLAGEIVALVRLPELVDHPHRNALLRAVSEHDNGWWEEDAAPRLDPESGGPLDFRAGAADVRREIWERCAARHSAGEPYVAALIAGHLLRLAPTGPEPDWTDFRDSLDVRRRAWLEAAAVEVSEASEDDLWLQLGDELSLVAATGEPAFLQSAGWRSEIAGTEDSIELRVTPFPWAGATRFELPVRRLPIAPYPDAVALGRAWISAPRQPLSIRLSPLDG